MESESERIIKDWHNARGLYMETYPNHPSMTLTEMMEELLAWMKIYSK